MALKSFAKGSVKKIAANKLLGNNNRRRVAKQRMQEVGEYKGGGALVRRGSSNIVPTNVSSSALTISESSNKESNKEGLEGTLLRIKTSTVNIDTILRGSLKLDRLRSNTKRKETENQKRSEREGNLEKKDKKQGGTAGKFDLAPKMGFLGKIKNFLVNILFGWLAVKLLKILPQLLKIIPVLSKAVDFVFKWGGKFLNAISFLVEKAYQITDGIKTGVGKLFGEKGVRTFEKFQSVFTTLMNAALITAMIAARGGLLGGNMGFGAGGIFRRGLGRTLPRLGLRIFGRAGLAKLGAAGTTIKGGLASASSTVGSALTGTAAVTTGVVAGVGLLASGLGEGAFQLNKWGEGKERLLKEKYDSKLWIDPAKYFWGAGYLLMLTLNRVFGFFGNLLDIIGAPFRYLIELIRYPFLDEAGKKKQRENLAKFDARIREGFRKTFNFLSGGFAFKEEGSFGSLFGPEGTDAMGYTSEGKDETIDAITKSASYENAIPKSDITIPVSIPSTVPSSVPSTVPSSILSSSSGESSESDSFNALYSGGLVSP